ncbi:cytochrome c [Oceanobacillus piezotolerans]|uniref:Cytochrome c n=1 Tax=Oceanobacillus piezotolerans TaxID=2448030 RepID=A0A498DHQ8_9BACI|nr:cytochrome c [Oceanobacillus piezotolerans]RLL48059.1 cytochrome c [Oceanobacillus piezotolerans]
MKNPIIPYAIIAVIGVLAVIIISYVGAGQREAIQNEEEGGTGTEQAAEGEVATDPEEIFASNCAACHGADLSGGAGPDLTQVGSKYSSEEIVDIIQNGTGTMPAQSQVAAEEATALADWLAEKQ